MGTVTRRVLIISAGLMLLVAGPASAQRRRGGGIVVVPRVGFYSPFFYGPFGPWYPYGYPNYYYTSPQSSIRTKVTPKNAGMYVDGYYAGVADDFDGIFKHLNVSPGGHSVTAYLDGYRTVTQHIYVRPDSTFKLNLAMAPVSPGETSAPVPPATPRPPRRQ